MQGLCPQVGRLLDHPDMAAARLVCTAWSTGIALGVTHLRPKLSGINGKGLGLSRGVGLTSKAVLNLDP